MSLLGNKWGFVGAEGLIAFRSATATLEVRARKARSRSWFDRSAAQA